MPDRSGVVNTNVQTTPTYTSSNAVAHALRTTRELVNVDSSAVLAIRLAGTRSPTKMRVDVGAHGKPPCRLHVVTKIKVSKAIRLDHANAAPNAPNFAVSTIAAARYGKSSNRCIFAMNDVRPDASI